ncbi:MAG: sugar phosphate nucleotidyltransferase [Candidatus Dojkabacteria bacterium]
MPQVTTLPSGMIVRDARQALKEKKRLEEEANKPPEKRIKKAIITAAGRGTRFLPITKIVPKEMLPLGNLPTIHFLIEECKRSGIEEVAIVVREWGSLTEKYFEQDRELEDYLEQKGKTELLESIKDPSLGLKISFVKQDPSFPYGNAAPVLSAENFFDEEDFLLIFGDDLLKGNRLALDEMSRGWFADDALGAMLSGVEKETEDIIHKFGIIDVAQQHETGFHYVKGFVEKPGPKEVVSNITNVGRVLMRGEISEYLKRLLTVRDSKREFMLWDAIMMMQDKYEVGVTTLSSYWYTTGTPEELKLAARKFAKI